jgi:flagellar motor switch protein FliN/FliY
VAEDLAKDFPITTHMTTDIQTILKLHVPVIVQIGQRQLRLENILALGPGAILELNKPSDADLDLLVNNKVIGHGQAVKVGENFGIRILTISPQEQIVQAMGR